MLTLHIRWKVLYQTVCLFRGHVWQEYAVIHAAWNWPGRYCTRCRKSVLRKSEYGLKDGVWQPLGTTDDPQPWLSLKVG